MRNPVGFARLAVGARRTGVEGVVHNQNWAHNAGGPNPNEKWWKVYEVKRSNNGQAKRRGHSGRPQEPEFQYALRFEQKALNQARRRAAYTKNGFGAPVPVFGG